MTPKFRAWNKTNNEMISWSHLLNGYNLRNVFMRPDMCGLELMESTDVTDKNGVEIYEGFLVKPERGEPFIVKHFIKEQGIIKNVNISTSGHSFEGIYSGAELEVIGDIHTNQKLTDITECEECQ